MGLEVFAEGELFGESEAVGHFLDGHAGLYEEVLGLVDGEELNRHRRGIEEGAKKGESNTAVRTSIAGCGLGALSLYHPPPDSYWECL